MKDDERICAAVRDLLPLWQEGLVSEETAAFVARHLADCPSCASLHGAAVKMSPNKAHSDRRSTQRFAAAEQFWRRLRRRTGALAAAVAVLVFAAAATGAVLVRSRQETQAQRYEAFLRTVPGYMAASADGSLISLRRTIAIGGERVTLQSFHATYFGSYLIFTAQRHDGLAAVLPRVDASTETGAIARTSAPIGDGEIAGYIDLTRLQVPSPSTAPQNRKPPTHFTLQISLLDGSSSMALTLPSDAYEPKAVRVLRHPMTVQAGPATVRFERLTISSAGTLIQGKVHGVSGDSQIDLPMCPAFVGKSACGPVDVTSQTVPSRRAWQPFFAMRWAPAEPASKLRNVALLLAGGVRVIKTVAVARKVDWPFTFPAGTAPKQITLGSADGYAVQLLPADEMATLAQRGPVVQIVPTSKTQPKPSQMSLGFLTVTLPDGTTLRADGVGVGEGGSAGDWFYLLSTNWKVAPTAVQLKETGMATIRVSLHTHPLLAFPKGSVWRP